MAAAPTPLTITRFLLQTRATPPYPSLNDPKTPHKASFTTLIPKFKNVGHDVKAALHLANDDIHLAHEEAQQSEGTQRADWVHQVVHRREGDYWNSKWWLSTISASSSGLPAGMLKVHGSVEGARAFVDACERADIQERAELERRQWEEIKEILTELEAELVDKAAEAKR